MEFLQAQLVSSRSLDPGHSLEERWNLGSSPDASLRYRIHRTRLRVVELLLIPRSAITVSSDGRRIEEDQRCEFVALFAEGDLDLCDLEKHGDGEVDRFAGDLGPGHLDLVGARQSSSFGPRDENDQTPSINATKVIADNEEQDDDVVDSAGQEIMDAAQQDDDDQGVTNADLATEDAAMQAIEGNEDDDENNIPLSSEIEVLRRGNANDDDNVVLSLKYQATPQELILVDTEMEVDGVNSEEIEVEVFDQNLSAIDNEEELYGIDDVNAYIDIVVEKTFDDIF
ncbi:hypothetical protein Dimus_018714 [Dionaea muscipula]